MGERRRRHILGKRLVEGVRLRSLPQVELPWITTFNLRWWRHAEQDEPRPLNGKRGQAGIPT